tara:strand:- start:191 stop:508 length:318 start_codon:yes stop_codon:yes gene_type:complete
MNISAGPSDLFERLHLGRSVFRHASLERALSRRSAMLLLPALMLLMVRLQSALATEFGAVVEPRVQIYQYSDDVEVTNHIGRLAIEKHIKGGTSMVRLCVRRSHP